MGVLQDIWNHRQSGPRGPGRMPDCVTLSGFCRWLRIKAADFDSESVDWLLALDLPAGLTMDGGFVRFPGAEIQDHAVHWRVVRGARDRFLRPEDRFQCAAPTFFLAAIGGLVTAYELRTLRKRGP